MIASFGSVDLYGIQRVEDPMQRVQNNKELRYSLSSDLIKYTIEELLFQ